jgi:hypothetical protein
VEVGLWFKERYGVYVGVLAGPVADRKGAACPYIGLSFNL